jgi:hypothetical protein
MQASSATKDSDQPGSGGLNWRQRKKAVARRKQLIDGYVAALGGSARVTATQMTDVERAVDMTMLALDMRTRALRGDKVAITDLVRLEGAADRAVRRLNLPAPGSAAPVMDLHDHAAKRALERAKAQPLEEAD